MYRGSASEHVSYYKNHRKYYHGSVTKNTDLTCSLTLVYNVISITTCLRHRLKSVFSMTLYIKIFSEALPLPEKIPKRSTLVFYLFFFFFEELQFRHLKTTALTKVSLKEHNKNFKYGLKKYTSVLNLIHFGTKHLNHGLYIIHMEITNY